MRSIFDAVKNIQAIDPIAASAAQTSAAIDTKGFNTGAVVIINGVATGTPTSYTVDAKVQHCDTSSGSYADVSGAAITQIIADSRIATIRLSGFGTSLKRYIKIVVTPALTGGSSPKALVGATVQLGRAEREPVGNTQ
jgi:hypothetical protein